MTERAERFFPAAEPHQGNGKANRRRLPWIAAALLLNPVSGHTADLAVGASASVAEEFNTNIFLTPNPHKESFGQGFNASLNMAVTDPRWQSSWNADFVNRWYAGNSDLDYDNQLFSTRNYYLISERSRIGLDANYNKDNTLSSSADAASDLGYVFRRLRRDSWGVSPNWTYSLTERTRLSSQYSYQETTYENKGIAAGSVVDSMSHSGVATLEHQYSEKLSLRAVGLASTYGMPFEEQTFSSLGVVLQQGLPVLGITTVTSGGEGSIDSQSLSLGFSYTPDETLKLDFSGGGQFNQVSNPGATVSFEPLLGAGKPTSFDTSTHSSSFSEILSAEATKKFERGEFGFTYSKSLSPNLLGLLISSERYGFTGRYSWTEQLSSNFRLFVTETATGGGADSAIAPFYQRSMFEIGSGLGWNLTERLSLTANYLYKRIEYPSLGREAEDHSVFLRLQYTPEKIHY